MKRQLLGFTALVGLWPALALAQPQTEIVNVIADKLEETLPQELARTGVRLTTVDSQSIEEHDYTDIQQALQYEVPGLSIQPYEGPFGYAFISLQGSRPSDILYTIDGIRLNNRLYPNTTPFDTIPAHMVERVEVLEGGQALFYGTQAIAGAINIVTRPFTTGPKGMFGAGFDTNDSYNIHAYFSDSIGSHRFVLYGSSDYAYGYQPYRSQDYQPSGTDRTRSYDVKTIGGKYAHDFSDDVRLSATYQHTDATLDISRPDNIAESFNHKIEDLLSAKLDVQVQNGLDIFAKGYYHNWDVGVTELDNSKTTPGAIIDAGHDVPWGFWDYGFNTLARWQTGSGFDLYGGWDMQSYYGKDVFYNVAAQSEIVHALFGQVRLADGFVPNLHLAAGFRTNMPSEADSSTVWNVSGQYDVMENFFIKGTVGTGFRLPSAGELFVDYHEPGYNEIGNPKLLPETSFNVNGSIGGTLGGMFRWEAVGFYRTVGDLIDYIEVTPDTYTLFNSSAEVIFQGFELIGAVDLGNNLVASGSYTYTDAHADGSSTQIERIPDSSAQFTLDWSPMNLPFGAAVGISYTGEVHRTQNSVDVSYGNYAVVDLSARYYLDPDRHHRLKFRLENVFDEVYGMPLGRTSDLGAKYIALALSPPRTFHIGYDYNF